ncbi:hypothetical protein LQW54_003813 [Pestalotiopsis sp. IQ-011]
MSAGGEDKVRELIVSYNELNSSAVEELFEEPSPLEFMRFVARNTPFVVRGGARDWPAARQWNVKYLREALRGHRVNVAVTPYGNADAPTLDADGNTVFAKPYEEDQPFEEFIDYLTKQELGSSTDPGEVRYAQTQNDNLRHEYSSLFSETLRSIPFARIALDKEPDAINMWVGNSLSTTAMHRDNYENVYVQVAGQKHFVLLPALCQPCINEQELRPAAYVRGGDKNKLRLELEDGPAVPFAVWDPDRAHANATKYSHLAEPVRVTLDPGDMLYLPAMW